MPESVHKCPNCGAVVDASRFARVATCAYCNATVHLDEAVVSAARFRASHAAWRNSDPPLGAETVVAGGEAWIRLAPVARGEISDVFQVVRQRWPGERALLKVLRNRDDAPLFDQEWRALTRLAECDGPGLPILRNRLPQPIVCEPHPSSGWPRMLLGWSPGFEHTFEDVRGALPSGVDARAAVWMWRRVLEILSAVHRNGLVHGAVLPQHLLVERGEHGVRLVGFSCANEPDAALLAVCLPYERFYPRAMLDGARLRPEYDVAMSARAILFVLGARDDGRLPSGVPAPLAALLESAADGRGELDAWALRERVGAVGRQVFGRPTFCPLEIASM